MDYKNIIFVVLIIIATIKKISIKTKKSKPPSDEPIEYGCEKITIDNAEHQKLYLNIPTIEIEIILRTTISSILFKLFNP